MLSRSVSRVAAVACLATLATSCSSGSDGEGPLRSESAFRLGPRGDLTPPECKPDPLPTSPVVWEGGAALWDGRGARLVNLGFVPDERAPDGSLRRDYVGVVAATGAIAGRARVAAELAPCFEALHGDVVIPLPAREWQGNLTGHRPPVEGTPEVRGSTPYPSACVPSAVVEVAQTLSGAPTNPVACVVARPGGVAAPRPW